MHTRIDISVIYPISLYYCVVFLNQFHAIQQRPERRHIPMGENVWGKVKKGNLRCRNRTRALRSQGKKLANYFARKDRLAQERIVIVDFTFRLPRLVLGVVKGFINYPRYGRRFYMNARRLAKFTGRFPLFDVAQFNKRLGFIDIFSIGFLFIACVPPIILFIRKRYIRHTCRAHYHFIAYIA